MEHYHRQTRQPSFSVCSNEAEETSCDVKVTASHTREINLLLTHVTAVNPCVRIMYT